VTGEAEFTVTLLRLFFLGQHLSETLESSDVMHTFLFDAFSFLKFHIPFLNITSYSQFNIITEGAKNNYDNIRNAQAFISVSHNPV
jgi:hypothetical protein